MQMKCKNGVLVDSCIWMYLEGINSSDEKVAERARLCFEALKGYKLDLGFQLYHSFTIFRETVVYRQKPHLVKDTFKFFSSKLVEENEEVSIVAARKYSEYLEEFKLLRDLNSHEVVRKSKSMPNDCVIGATALVYDLAICTNNDKDFRKRYPEVEILNPLKL